MNKRINPVDPKTVVSLANYEAALAHINKLLVAHNQSAIAELPVGWAGYQFDCPLSLALRPMGEVSVLPYELKTYRDNQWVVLEYSEAITEFLAEFDGCHAMTVKAK